MPGITGRKTTSVAMSRERVLVVDDEQDLLELVSYNLNKEGFRVVCVSSGEEALAAARRDVPDLILLDLLLPTVDGLEVCRRLKADSRTQHIPVLMLTAKSEETDVVTGLELGAEDYVTKPFSPRVLVARVKAVLRRRTKESSDDEAAVTVHDLVIHPGWHEVLLAGKPIDLTFTEFRLLHFLRASRVGLSRAAKSWMPSRERIIPSPSAAWMCKSPACGRSSARMANTSRPSAGSDIASKGSRWPASGCCGNCIPRMSWSR